MTSLDYLTADVARIGHSGAPSSDTTDSSDNIFVNKLRKIPAIPYKTLDAPNLCDDFYLNLVDWSSTNILAMALGQYVYVWNANTSAVCELVDLGQLKRVTSVSWSQNGQFLSVGT